MTDEPKGKLIGKTWYIPEDAQKPERANKKNDTPTLLQILREQKPAKMTDGIYHKIQNASAPYAILFSPRRA